MIHVSRHVTTQPAGRAWKSYRLIGLRIINGRVVYEVKCTEHITLVVLAHALLPRYYPVEPKSLTSTEHGHAS